MPAEIERKFLIRRRPPRLSSQPCQLIAQGYLCIAESGSEVRLRRMGKKNFITVKGTGAMRRSEVQTPLTSEQFKRLWPLTREARVHKMRYRIPWRNAVIELDIYRGALSGLMVAEVEFKSMSAAKKFEPPAWFDREITDDERYKNKNLARMSHRTTEWHGFPSRASVMKRR